MQKTKTLHRTKNISKSRGLKTSCITAITKWEDDLVSDEEKDEEMKLDHFVGFWRKEIAPMTLRLSTQEVYNDLIDRIILPNLGHIYLQKITPAMVQKMINEQAKKRLVRRTVKYPLQVLSSILSHAIRLDKIQDNPCSRVVLPNTEQQMKIELEKKRNRDFSIKKIYK